MAAAAKKPGVWGIDLGQCALKAIRLEEQDGEIQATAFDYIEHPKILSQPDADPDQLTREALEKFLSRNDLSGDTVAIGVPGQAGLARFVKLPPVDPKKVTDIVRFEAKQQIPFPLHEVVWGYQQLGAGTKTDKMILDAEIGLFAMKRDIVNRALQHFKDVGVEVHFIQMAPLALCNFLAHDLLGKGAAKGAGDDDDEAKSGDKTCVVGLDIGADNSNLVITDGEKIIWQRPIPLGGNHFTRALTKDLKLTFAKAEHLKRNAVKSPDLKKILAALKPVLNDFVSEVQRSLGYFTNTHRDATIKQMLGLGNAFRLPGLQKYLQEKLQLEVRKLSKIQRLAGDEEVTQAPQYVENAPSFGVAHGLALQGLGITRIHVNLLPPEIAKERLVRAKKPWVLAAAAVLLLISPPLLLGWSATKSAWTTPGVKDANKRLQQIVTSARGEEAEAEKIEKEAEESRKRAMSLAGGIEERLNWLHLHSVINAAVPRPDGTHLVDNALSGSPVYRNYVEVGKEGRMTGKAAFKRWQELKAKVAKGDALSPQDLQEEEDFKQSLVLVHVENVVALWSEDLHKEFFKQLTMSSTMYRFNLNGFKKQEQDVTRGAGTGNPKRGWIVEIRGYTYHYDQNDFVLNTLVENLVDLADPDTKNRRLKGKDNKMVELHPAVEKTLKEKEREGIQRGISHVLLYDFSVVRDPKPGQFVKINQSHSAQLANVFGQRAKPGARPEVVTQSGPDQPLAGRAAQMSWRPPEGSLIMESFQHPIGLKGGAPAKVDADKAAKTLRLAPRTEFVVMFVWQQPYAP